MKKIVILDYGIGNIRSIYNALKNVDADPVVSNDKQTIMTAAALILPGVGAFKKGMENLERHNLLDPIHLFTETGKPFLGICLGMQMLLQASEEFGHCEGLGLIKGKVKKLEVKDLRLPHVSWNEVESPSPDLWSGTIFNGIARGTNMYFVHSFAAYPEYRNNILASTNYDGSTFCSAVKHDNIYGVQFHPEKSGNSGLEILRNFVRM